MTPGRWRRSAGAWDKDVLVFLSGAGTDPRDATAECLDALRSSLRERGLRPADAVKLTLFVRADEPAGFQKKKRAVAGDVRSILPACHAAVGVVAQSPEGDREIALEAMVLRRRDRSLEIIPKRRRGVPYLVLQSGSGKEVLAGGLSGRSGDLRARTASAFAEASAILAQEGLSFTDVVRQWNYVEDITGRSGRGRGGRQNYQIFNDIRAEAYDRDGLRSGFPAATGIGTSAGGFVLELVGAAGTAAERSYAVSNPLQADAHSYSSKVLVGSANPGSPKRTPKFERARVVLSGGAATCYVSGTAAIVGEDVVEPGDAAGQTRATVRNIERLVSAANLRRSGAPVASVGSRFSYVRTYVKRGPDIPDVARIVRRSFPGAPALFIAADICRRDLLVEIEGAVDVVTD